MKHPREGAFLFRSSQQLPIIRHGLFEPTRHLSMALDSPRALLPEQGHRQVCRAIQVGPRTLSKTADANLDGVFVKKHRFFTAP